MTFSERTPIETGFAAVYERDVWPKLQEFEFERQAGRKKTLRNMGLIAAGVVAVVAAAIAIWGAQVAVPALLLGAIMGGIFVYSEWDTGEGRWKTMLTDAVMPSICDHVGDLSYASDGSRFDVDPMVEMRILPKYDDVHRRSLLRGTHAGHDYQIVHARLTVESNSDNGGSQTAFEGLLFRLTLPEAAPGRIALLKDRGGFGNTLAETFSFGSTRSWPRVEFEDADFEAAFAVYADQPDAARAFLSAARRDALMQIRQDNASPVGPMPLLAGFDGRDFYLALERRGGFIDIGGLNNAATDVEDCLHGAFDDIAMSHRIMDRLTAV